MQCRRAAFAEAHKNFHAAEIVAPLELSIHVVTIKPARAEKGPDAPPVGHGRRRGVRTVGVCALVGDLFTGDLLPEEFAGLAVEALNNELERVGGGWQGESTAGGGGRRGLEGDGGLHEDAVAPDYRRGRAVPLGFSLSI